MTEEIVKLDKSRDSSTMDKEALWYDDAILHYRYHKVKVEGRKYEGWSLEDFVNYHVLIVKEFKKRSLPHFDRGDDLDKDSKPFLKDYAEVHPSGEDLGGRIYLKDVLPYFQSFRFRHPYVWLVGGIVCHPEEGTTGDIDILIRENGYLPPEFLHVLQWRIMRALPRKYWNRVQFHTDRFHGPFTDYVPLYSMDFTRINPENEILRMSGDGSSLLDEFEKSEVLEFISWAEGKQLIRTKNPEMERQAKESKSEDRVKLLRFFLPMKPIKGTFPEQRQTIKTFLSLFEDDDFPVYSTKKFDGYNAEIHKSGDKVFIVSEDGEDSTGRLPGVVKAVQALNVEDLVFLAEIERWRKGKHLPRETVAGYIHAKTPPDDSDLVANVYDIVYFEDGKDVDTDLDTKAGDIHKLDFSTRMKYLGLVDFKQSTTDVPDVSTKLNKVPFLVSHNREDLKKHTEELSRKPGSEGNVAKKASGGYSLAGRSDSQIKFHVSTTVTGIVIRRIETKVKGTYNYLYGVKLPGEEVKKKDTAVIKGKKYLIVGKTFSTNQFAKPGDVIEVEIETLNFTTDLDDDTVSLTGWAPRFMKVIDREEPDGVEDAVARAKKDRVYQEKEITPDGETVFKNGRAPEDTFEKASYVGNKRRLAKYIVRKFPKDAKVIFDPMIGCSAVPIEAVRTNGYRVIGNDLSVIAFWFSKGIFEGAQLSEKNIEKILNSKPHDGWLTTKWKGMYPRKREIRRFIDGVVKTIGTFRGKRLLAARAVASRFLQTMYSDSGSGYSTRNWETIPDVKRVLGKAIKEVNQLVGEVSGRGKITSLDARTMRFPKSDVVYFDPPFFPRKKGPVKYFDTYRIANSVLLQKEWKEKNLKKEEVSGILKRLCESTKQIFISTARDSRVQWGAELGKHKRTVRKYRLAYDQTSGFPAGRESHQEENLLFGKELEKQVDPYMRLPSEDETHRYVVQEHFRGKSMHADFRIESLRNESLIGWTLNTLIKDVIEEPVLTLADVRRLESSTYSKIDWDTGAFSKRKKKGAEKLVDVEIVSQRKAVEPHAWLDVEGVTKPGTVGATKQYPGVFLIVDKGMCEYGTQKPWVHEYFPESDRKKGGLRYRIFFRQLRVEAIQAKSDEEIKQAALDLLDDPSCSIFDEDWDLRLGEILKEKELVLPAAETKFREEAAWLLMKPIDQTPYVLSERSVDEKWVPPQGFSALPERIRNKIPKEYRYWLMASEKDRLAMRDALVQAIEEGEAKIEKASLSDARFVLQYHYFRKRGEKPVREGPTTWHYDLRIDVGKDHLLHWVLDHDITEADQTVGYYKEDKDKRALTAEGFFPPGTLMNPTKDTSAFVEIVDKGRCIVMIDDPQFKKLEFKGRKLKGVWVLDKKNDNWLVSRSQAAPAAKGERQCNRLTLAAV